MRRDGTRQPYAILQHASWNNPAKPLHFGRVIVLLDTRLDRLPVLERPIAVSPNESRRHHGLADVRVGAGYEDPAEQTPTSLSAAASDTVKRSIASSDCPLLTEIRRRE